MHHFMKELREKAKKNLKTIVFPETEDPRVAEAMKILEKEGLCKALSITEEERERSRIALKNLLPDETMINNNHIGALLVKEGKADGMVSGSLSPTANVLKATFKIVGTDKPEMKVSSCFIMLKKQVFFFADCAVQPHPDSEALADIAVTTAATAQSLGVTPKVAMLSFSSKGSANTESV